MAKQLSKILDELESAGLKRLDPVSFAYIEGLNKRLSKNGLGTNDWLLGKLSNGLESGQAQHKDNRENAKAALAWIADNSRAAFPQACELFASYRLRELIALKEREEVRKPKDDMEFCRSHLFDLIEALNKDESLHQENKDDLTFEQRLIEQESVALGEGDAIVENRTSSHAISSENTDLQSLKVFKRALEFNDVDRLISRALNECPPNPGPHNPQMLAIRALTELKSLSPSYARKFAAYLESMLWLEKGAERLNKSSTK